MAKNATKWLLRTPEVKELTAKSISVWEALGNLPDPSTYCYLPPRFLLEDVEAKRRAGVADRGIELRLKEKKKTLGINP
jgi:hypothetical protein